MMKSWIVVASAWALLLGGCASDGPAKLEAYGGPGNSEVFGGVLRGVSDQPTSPRVRYVFHIHGMGLTEQAPFRARLVDQVQSHGYQVLERGPWLPAMLPTAFRVSGPDLDCTSSWTDHLNPGAGSVEHPCDFPSFGEYSIDRMRAGDGREVRIVTYYWHRDLWRIQEPYLRKDMLRPRAKWTGALKDNVISGGLSDAAVYVGTSRPLVRAGISSALCAMALNADGRKPISPNDRSLTTCTVKGGLFGPADAEFNFVTHSLGSRMLFDVLAPSDNAAEFAQTRRRDTARGYLVIGTRSVFMAANQMPLLGATMVDVRPMATGAEAAPAPEPCRSAISLIAARCAVAAEGAAANAPNLQIVAFSDPDDLLGYRASDAGEQRPGLTFLEVTHRNTPVWFGRFVLPQEAHDKELQRKSTAAMILCGAVAGRDGGLTPRSC